MCNPMMLMMAQMGGQFGQSLLSFQGQKAEAEAQNQMYDLNRENALASMRNEYQAAGLRQLEEGDANAQQAFSTRQLQAQQMAAGNVSAGEAGISGISVERVLGNLAAQAGQDITLGDRNLAMTNNSIDSNLRSTRLQTKARIESESKGVKPSALGAIFKFGVGAADSYGQYKNRQAIGKKANA